MLSRRSIFGASAAAVAVAAMPAAAAAPQPDAWDVLVTSLKAIHPKLEHAAREAQAAGMYPDELTLVFCQNDGSDPFLTFRREYGVNPGPRTYGMEAH